MAKPKMHRVEGSAAELSTEEALMHAAVATFSEKGFDATSVQDIATRAGVAKGLLYHYFSSKDDILRRVMHRVLDDLLGALVRALDEERDPVEQLYACIDAMADLVGRNRAGVAMFVEERRRLSRSEFADVLARSEEMVQRVTAVLERGIAAGKFRSLPSTRTMALGLIGMATWEYQWYRPGLLPLPEVAEMYANVVVGGLALTPSPLPRVHASPHASIGEAGTAPSTKEALARAAQELIARNGYDRTSISNLANHIGVTTGAFYSNFASKHEILRYIDNRFLDRLLESMDRVLDRGLPASETLAYLIAETMSEVGDHRTELAIFLQEWRFFGTDAFADVRLKSAEFVNRFTSVLDAGAQAGEFRRLPSPKIMSYGLIGLCCFDLQWSASDEFKPEAAQMFAEVVLTGLRAERTRRPRISSAVVDKRSPGGSAGRRRSSRSG
jgi:TetR/AcrR family transcriptional regulator, cholesterol catabolism regulator